jgi:hypothetical protein
MDETELLKVLAKDMKADELAATVKAINDAPPEHVAETRRPPRRSRATARYRVS